MVRHVHGTRDYWTLPGGGVGPNETAEAAVVREVREEVSLVSGIVRPLYRRGYISREGQHVGESCFLLRAVCPEAAALGHDPELDADSQILRGVAWFPLEHLRDDIQVSRVIHALGMSGDTASW